MREKVDEYFEMRPNEDSPYMLLVAPVREDKRIPVQDPDATGIDKLKQQRSVVPAITHVDYSARVQTVDEKRHPRVYRILKAFEERTGSPVLINTSFNVRGEPIVCTPEDAFRCFMGTGIETLAVGNCHLRKEDQDPALAHDYKESFELD